MATQDISNTQENWDLIIRPQRAWWDVRLEDLWKYRDLIWLFVWRDFVSMYKQTVLGPLWYLIGPILSATVFTFIFDRIAGLPTDGIPPFLFYLAGNTVWSYFSACLVGTSRTFIQHKGIFTKVYFPRLAIPVSIVISDLISFTIRISAFLAILIYFVITGSDVHFTYWVFLLPVLLIIMAGLGLGIGIIVSSLTTKYRDLQNLVSFGMQLLMYATPVIYPLSTVQEGPLRNLIRANPLTPIVEIFRMGFLGSGTVEPLRLLYSAGIMLIVFLIGVLLFTRVETTFMDTV